MERRERLLVAVLLLAAETLDGKTAVGSSARPTPLATLPSSISSENRAVRDVATAVDDRVGASGLRSPPSSTASDVMAESSKSSKKSDDLRRYRLTLRLSSMLATRALLSKLSRPSSTRGTSARRRLLSLRAHDDIQPRAIVWFERRGDTHNVKTPCLSGKGNRFFHTNGAWWSCQVTCKSR